MKKLLFLLITLSVQAQPVPTTSIGGGIPLFGSGSQNTTTNNTTWTNSTTTGTINNGYAQGTQVSPQSAIVRLNLRLHRQINQQTATYRQYRINLRLGRHGFLQQNNNTSNNNTQNGNNGNNTNGGGSNNGNNGNNSTSSSNQGNQTNQQGTGTITSGTTNSVTSGSTNIGLPSGVVGMQAPRPNR